MKKYNNVYTFFGADSKVGTTMVVTSIAEALGEYNNVLVINANKRTSIDYLENVESSFNGIDALQNKLESNILNYDDIQSYFIQSVGFKVIGGVKDLEKCRHFRIDDIEKILDLVANKSNLILIDAGCDFEYNALAIGSLMCTDHTVLVTTQQESSKRGMDRVFYLTERMNLKFNSLLINKKQPKGVAVIDIDTLHELSGIENLLGTISNSPYSWQSESDYSTLRTLDNEFKTDINIISNKIAEDIQINKTRSPNVKKRFKLFK